MASLSVAHRFVALLVGLVVVELIFALRWPGFQSPVRIDSQAVGAKIRDFGYSPKSAISAWSAEVLARPLFASSRRPSAAPSRASAARIGISRLSGIIITSTEKIAVFSPSTGGPIIVTKNSRFGPFAVLSITADSVTVKGPDGVVVIHPDIGDQGRPGNSTPVMTTLPGGIAVYLIKVPLGSVEASWPLESHPL